MKQFLVFLIGLLLMTDCLACECEPLARDSSVNKALRYSDLIFLGEFIPSFNSDPFVEAYKFKILELFKGDYNSVIIHGCITGMCSLTPQEKGIWIIYAKQVNDSTIDISNCSPSIPLSKSKILIPPPSLFPEFENQTQDSLKVKIYKIERKIEGLTYWLSDLEKLREYRMRRSIINKKFDLRDVLISFFILTNIILIITLVRSRKN